MHLSDPQRNRVVSDRLNFQTDFLVDRPEALPVISRWLYDEFLYLNPGQTIEMRESLMRLRAHATKIPLAIVGYHEKTLVGTASLIADDLPERPEFYPWLASVFVPPKFRGNSFGSKLCLAIKQIAKDLGYREIFLFTPDQQKLYASLGWETIEESEYHGTGLSIMRASLDN